MSIVNEPDEMQDELQVVESKKLADTLEPISYEIPERFKGKELKEVIKMLHDSELMVGKQAQEVGEVRKLADELLKQNLAGKEQPQAVEPEVDFFENPQEAVRRTVDNHPDVLAARQAGQEFKKMQIQQKLTQEHPDYSQIVQDTDFVNWVKSSPIRLGLYAKADGEFDYDSANELLSTFKQIKGVKARQTTDAGEAQRKSSLKAAGVDMGGTGESGKRIYRRADLIRLKMQDPARYDALNDEILAAYAEGRVK